MKAFLQKKDYKRIVNTLLELKTASSLVEAPHVDTKEKDLVKIFDSSKDIKKRNTKILKAIGKGYSQHSIAKVLRISRPAVNGVIKRSRK